MQYKRYGLPIHVHLTTIIIAVVVLTSGMQIWLSNKGLSELSFEANSKLFDRIAAETQYQLKGHYNTALAALGVFAESHNLNSNTQQEREESMPQVAHLLTQFKHISSYAFYYPSGDFFSVTSVRGTATAQRLGIPSKARFIVTHHIAGKVEIVALNQALETIAEIDPSKAVLFKSYDWFTKATNKSNVISTPTIIPETEELGVNIYRKSKHGIIISATVALKDLSLSLDKTLTNNTSLRVLYNGFGQVYASSGTSVKIGHEKQAFTIDLLDESVISHAVTHHQQEGTLGLFTYNGERWFGRIVTLESPNKQKVHLLMAAKASALFNDGQLIQQQTLYSSLLILLLTLPVIYMVSTYISKPIKRATQKAKDIEGFNFDSSSLPNSYIREIHELNHAQVATQSTISRFISLTHNISHKENLNDILELVCRDTASAVEANGVFLYLLDIPSKSLVPEFVWWEGAKEAETIARPVLASEAKRVMHELFIAKKSAIFDVGDLHKLNIEWDEQNAGQIVCIPLKDRSGSVIGSFGLLYDGDVAACKYKQYEEYLDTLLGFTSVTIETHNMMDGQKALLDSFIQVIAGSLDKKSPFTGHHCQRVPIITQWLTEAAQTSSDAPFHNFSLNEKQWEELKMASWLHDCGKITTPDHIVDKSTKLETLYDRIHEVRMRFEVLKRDAELEVYKSQFGLLPEQETEALASRLKQIDEDFAFIAELNLGGEFVSDEVLERLNNIAQQTWTRTLSKRIGISWQEGNRYHSDETLPVFETLLHDGEEHLIDWQSEPNDEERFTLKPTKYQANLGELYNLSIRRGTLTEEDRFIINDHIIQTIKILESLPFPQHMRNVAKIAGGHHEKITGQGYPLGLKGNEMPLTARVIAIADVFEALTANDRPYKKAKTLSETIQIMSFMVKDGHLDGDLFKLLLSSGVYRKFAQEYMTQEQIDEVDIKSYLA
ncbi:HD domain-containing protein [Vibrio aquaticus]|uniref:HD domain-containing protein n=1 Tax=Vibrio aquaticus TaxID=2496559 RepID=A0A432D0S5_9VIBR|nr:HD domain-containing phosphohydrolase [Vibrio aquaticus]RTZ17465.1 HD domain-containing protein [Vibrio aquaticus]